MPRINKLILCGRLVKDPDIKTYGTNDKAINIASFTIALNDWVKEQDISYFFDCKCFGRTALHVEKYCQKGTEIIIEGKLVQERWEDKNTGDKRSSVRIVAERLQLVKYPSKEQHSDPDPYVDNIENGRPGNYQAPPINEDGDDILF